MKPSPVNLKPPTDSKLAGEIERNWLRIRKTLQEAWREQNWRGRRP